MRLFCIFLACFLGLGVAQNVTDVWGPFSYEPGEWEGMITALIRDALPSLPLESFVDDPQIRQVVDGDKGLTRYHETSGGGEVRGREIWVRPPPPPLLEGGEPFIILQSGEDRLPIKYRKRIWVVLVQNPEENDKYFVAIAYLRFLSDKADHCAETYLNEHICIEWDAWDGGQRVTGGHTLFGWMDCASSFLISCSSSNHTQGTRAGSGSLGQSSIRQGPRFLENGSAMDYGPPPSGIPVDDTIDAFWDLEVGRREGRLIRDTIRHSLRESWAEKDKDLSKIKEKLVQKSQEEKVARDELSLKLKSREEWNRTKESLDNRLQKYWKAARLADIPLENVRKGNFSEILEQFKEYDEAVGELLQDLDQMGQYPPGGIVPDPVVKREGSKPEVGVLVEADVAQMVEEDQGQNKELVSASASFATALGASFWNEAGESWRKSRNDVDKVAEAIAKNILFSSADTFTSPGWKFQNFNNFTPNASLSLESQIFYGFGSCPQNKTLTLTQGHDPVTLYLQLLRTHCLPETRSYLQALLRDKYLEVAHTSKRGSLLEYRYFAVNSKRNKFWGQEKLRRDEVRKLSAALELAAFSQVYVNEVKLEEELGMNLVGVEVIFGGVTPVTLTSTEVKKLPSLSRSVVFLRQFVFKYISLARRVGDEHFLKLVRNLVITLKGFMIKLIQDEEIILSHCPSPLCDLELRLNRADRLEIHALSQFLMRGLAPVEKDRGTDVGKVFQGFVSGNRAVLEESLTFYD